MGVLRITLSNKSRAALFLAVATTAGCAAAPRLEDYCTPLPEDVTAEIDSAKDETAQKYWAYAVLSNNVYEAAGHPRIWIDPNKWQAVCDDKQQTKSSDCEVDKPGKGLEAKTYLRWPDGVNKGQPDELIFAFRGTTSISDWWCGNLGDCQYDEADSYVKTRLDKYRALYPTVAIVATGHSLGGGLAQHIAFCVAGATAVAFNTSPRIHKHDCAAFTSNELTEAEEQSIERTRIVRIHQHAEILSWIRHLFSSNNYKDTVYNFSGGSLLSRHAMTPLAMGLTKVAGCPIQKGLNGFSSQGQPDIEAVPARTCAASTVAFHCAPSS